MSDSPWFSFYVGDFDGSTKDWEPDAVGVYVRFLGFQWVNGKLPIDDDAKLCRIAGIFPNQLDAYRWIIDEKFPDGKNPRLEKERNYREKQRGNGTKGGRPKKPKQNPTNNPKESQSETQTKPKPKASLSQLQSHIGTHTTRASDIPPCSLDEATQAGAQMMVCEDAVSKWWHEHDARGWVDPKGQHVLRWQSSLKAYGDTWRQIESRNNNRNGTNKQPQRGSLRTGDQSDADRYAPGRNGLDGFDTESPLR